MGAGFKEYIALIKHDGFFKSNMEDLNIAAGVLRAHLPQEIATQMDFTKLKLESGNLIERNLKQGYVDMLYSVPFSSENAMVFVLAEHQSRPDPLMVFRVLRYKMFRWAKALRKKKQKYLPPIFVVVLYNGPQPWRGPLRFDELFEPPFGALMLRQLTEPLNIIDVKNIPDQDLLNSGQGGVFQFLMKHIYDEDKKANLLEILPFLMQIEKEGDEEFVIRCLEYLASSGGMPEMLGIVEEHFNEEVVGKTMNTMDLYAEKAVQKKCCEIARKLMLQGVDPHAILEATGVDPRTL